MVNINSKKLELIIKIACTVDETTGEREKVASGRLPAGAILPDDNSRELARKVFQLVINDPDLFTYESLEAMFCKLGLDADTREEVLLALNIPPGNLENQAFTNRYEKIMERLPAEEREYLMRQIRKGVFIEKCLDLFLPCFKTEIIEAHLK